LGRAIKKGLNLRLNNNNMDFSLVEKQGVPDELMAEFYEKGGVLDNFGTTKYRAESDQYDTLALVVDQEVVGTADLLYPDEEASLGGCYILPDYREKLNVEGKSAFEHMAGVRLNMTDRPAKTSATTDHGATQHVYNKFDFSPYEFELPRQPHERSHITMAEPHEKRRFDREIYAPEAIREFVDHVASNFGQEVELDEGDYTGVEVNYMEDVFAEGYEFFKVSEGDQRLKSAISDIAHKKQGSTNVTVRIDSEVPSSYEVINELLEEDFRPSGYNPFIEGSQMSQTSRIHMSYSNELMHADLIPETKEFLKDGGWGVQMIEQRDGSSSEFKIF
jgi:hypothetical protein